MPQIREGGHTGGAELRAAEIHRVGVQVAGGEAGVVVMGAQPPQHAAVPARQVENVVIVRFVAEASGKQDELEGAPAEGEVLFLQTVLQHRIAR